MHSLIPNIGEITQIGVKIGILVAVDNNYRTDHQVNFCKIDYKSLDVDKGKAKISSPHSSLEVLPQG